MVEGNIRHMFPGGNTPKGFYSYYNYIIDRAAANKIFILKGGPGTGKSTFMKKIGYNMAKQGYNVEFMHCSSDSNSLDGIVIPKLLVAVIDGTSPHITDPVYPGAVDEIINLSQFWDEEGVVSFREEIILNSEKKKECFERVYRYLKSAYFLIEDTKRIFEKALDRGAESIFIHTLKSMLFGQGAPAKDFGKQRRLFASAITPKGYIDYLDSLCINHKIIRLSAPSGISPRNVIKDLNDEALNKGFFVEAYYCPMSPETIEHLVLPDLKVSIITANEYHDISDINNEQCTTYLMNEFYDYDLVSRYKCQLDFNRTYADAIIQKATESLALSMSYHDNLEKFYVNNMNFDALNKLNEKIMTQIQSYF